MDQQVILKIHNFAKGSHEIAKKIIHKNKNKSIYSVVGGGDTIAVINQINDVKNFDFVSTAGGAFLEYLEERTTWYKSFKSICQILIT